ncbi:MAG: diguanylate cyclase [Helicobacteraceae bacterium]|nr:diguanylate cyclase [Helicobacteraceae bacterium]
MLGYSDSELQNEFFTWVDLVHEDDFEKTMAGINKNIKGETSSYEGIHRLQHKNKKWIWIRDRAKVQYDESGKAIRMIGTHTDITKQKAQELKLSQQAQIIDQIHDSVITMDLDGKIVSWNLGSEKMLGYSESEIIGKHMSIIHTKEDIEQNNIYCNEFLSESSISLEAYLVTKSKEKVYVSTTLSIMKDETESKIGFIALSQDITIRKMAEDELREQKNILAYRAHHDNLTGLPNRALFNDRLAQSTKKALRHDRKIALFFIDLDHFKTINDTLGHKVGDIVLQEVSKKIKNILRDVDTLARLGGDEFTIIMEDIQKEKDAEVLAQKIVDILKEPMLINEHRLNVTSSIGISFYPKDSTDIDKLLIYADKAMYKAKDAGKNNFQFFSN